MVWAQGRSAEFSIVDIHYITGACTMDIVQQRGAILLEKYYFAEVGVYCHMQTVVYYY